MEHHVSLSYLGELDVAHCGSFRLTETGDVVATVFEGKVIEFREVAAVIANGLPLAPEVRLSEILLLLAYTTVNVNVLHDQAELVELREIPCTAQSSFKSSR